MTKENTENEQWKLLVLILKEIAENKGISHQQIADETGLVRSNVTRFLGGKYNPSLGMFIKVAKALDVNLKLEDK